MNCGPFIITQFWTIDGSGKLPLNTKIFQVDFTALTLTIKSNDVSLIGSYKVYYEVALKNYVTAKKSSTSPFTVIITKPNTAPTLSLLNSKQVTIEIELSNDKYSVVPVGKLVDAEGDTVTLTFDNNGQNSISFNSNSN